MAKTLKVVKRNGELVDFDKTKIELAITKAMKYGTCIPDYDKAKLIADELEKTYNSIDMSRIDISVIERDVFHSLIRHNESDVARSYEGYRKIREYQRTNGLIDNKILGIVDGTDKKILSENSNKNDKLISTQRDLEAEEISKDIVLRTKLPPHIVHAHKSGLIYLHDLGHYLNDSFNCCLVNLEDMLDNGTIINNKMIETPKSFQVACTIATQIIAQVASGQFGGQTISSAHLAPYIRVSKLKLYREVLDELELDSILKNDPDVKTIYDNINSHNVSKEEIDEIDNFIKEVYPRIYKIVDKRLRKEIKSGVQTIQYQINTLLTSNGQSPFLTIFMHISERPVYETENAMLIEEIIRQRLQGIKNRKGVWISPAFPKLVYVLDENNIHEDSEYYSLTKLCAKCVAHRMMPDFLSAKEMKKHYEGNVFGPMGCRAFLSPYTGPINNTEGEYKWYGRFNMGLTSINLLDAGLSANHDLDRFWKIFDERLDLVKESLLLRYEKLKDVTSDVSPIHWQDGAISRLGPHEPIGDLLKNGYATITLGYMGVDDCVRALIGESNTSSEGEKLSVQIVQHMKDKVKEWTKEYKLGFALYGTPAESLTDTFAKSCRERFGIIPGLTDKNYLTNSFHVNVREHIDPFKKLSYEAQFHAISSGGCISYIEMPNMNNNLDAIMEVMKFIYDNIQYAEFNTKLDYCQKCDYDGEMKLDENLHWYCPNCGNRDTDTMNIVRRTCGYLGENLWNEGRTEEISERFMHLDNHDENDE